MVETSEDDLLLQAAIPGIVPEDFRVLIDLAERREAQRIEKLTQENCAVDTLYFVLDGGIRMAKGEEERLIQTGIFVGEISYLSGEKASATIRIGAGTRYLRWDASELRKLVAERDGLRRSLEAAFLRDLAAKVASAR